MAIHKTVQRHRNPERRVVLLTGACTFIGQRLLHLLLSDRRYHRIVVADMRRPMATEARAVDKMVYERIDLTQPAADAAIGRLMVDHGVDTAIHLAYLSRPTHNMMWAHELEAIGTLHMLNACAASGVRKLVVRSHTAVYGARSTHPAHIGEDQPLADISETPFLADKVEAERLVARFRRENSDVIVTVLRTAPIVGPTVDNYVCRYLSPPVVPVVMGYDPLVQLLGERDAAEAFKIVVDADYGGEYNIAGDGVLPLQSVIALAGRVALPLPHSLAQPFSKVLWMTQLVDAPPTMLSFLRFSCVADTKRSRQELGFSPKLDIRQIVESFAGRRGSAASSGVMAGGQELR